MKVEVHKHNLAIVKDEDINEKEANIQKILFKFSDDYEGFLKYVLFTDRNNITTKYILEENVIQVPYFKDNTHVILGVYAEKVEDGKLYRLNPSPVIFCVENGSLVDADNHEEIIPSEFEQYMQLLHEGLEKIPSTIKEELENLNNIDLEDYVKKEEGKGLSTNDFTEQYKTKLDNLKNYDDSEIKKDISDLNKEIENISLTPGPKGDPFLYEDFTEEQLFSLKGTDGINGQNGVDGYTPQRGTDYWTETDIEDIKQYCSDYIDDNYLSLLGGSY